MRKFFFISLCIIGIFGSKSLSFSQSASMPSIITIADTGAYSIVERSDWRRFDNGRYTGLVYQELRATILPSTNGSALYQGNFFVMQNTMRDAVRIARGVDDIVPVSFELMQNGAIMIQNDKGFPRLRNFPTFPSRPLRPGDKWQAPGSRATDPLNTGNPLIIPFVAEYEYRGIEVYRDMLVHRINAGYASRYRNYGTNGNNGSIEENDFLEVQGSHNVDILVRVDDGLLVFMRDTLDVTYTLLDNSTIRFAGFTLTFGEGIIPMNRVEVAATINIPDADVVHLPEGIRLTIRDIRFAPDSPEFLPEERYRLDLIAAALKQIPDRNFLVDGHTAAVGRPAGEMELSIERARCMIDELVQRGISADRFIYKGWGGTVPIDDNSTEAGRNNNRRVEITILE
ncbi:MAG: OmpA family protein [Treponema sp.]|nr:OmpA family protein [Treponema sp.]